LTFATLRVSAELAFQVGEQGDACIPAQPGNFTGQVARTRIDQSKTPLFIAGLEEQLALFDTQFTSQAHVCGRTGRLAGVNLAANQE